jgi:hypothetical protein
MRGMSRCALPIIPFVLCAFTPAQEVPLGDLVRQQQQQKEQAAKKDPAAAAKPSKVFTNSDLPDPPIERNSLPKHPAASYTTASASSRFSQSAETWKTQITAQKNAVASLQLQFTQLSESIHFASGCVSGCVAWNERQKQKMDQADRMKLQLDDENKKLEAMQEAARRQGYGSSVYEP